MGQTDVEKGKSVVAELAAICRQLEDREVTDLFGDGTADDLLNSICNPSTVKDYPNIAEFFRANKHRLSFIAATRDAITRAFAIEGKTKSGAVAYASPHHAQWFEDGVMLLEGARPFEGLFGLYRNGEMSYAVAARDAQEGDKLGKDDFIFVDRDEFNRRLKAQELPKTSELELPITALRALLEQKESNESKYHELLKSNPWVLGLEYKFVQSHENLDDRNVPDFTAVRVSDGARDIFEIKPPTMSVFRADGEFTADFNTAWNQAERYLAFAREEPDYLRRKGLRFDNPKCTLVCGYNLEKQNVRKIRIKERMNPAIHLMTFNDLIAFMEATVKFILERSKLVDPTLTA